MGQGLRVWNSQGGSPAGWGKWKRGLGLALPLFFHPHSSRFVGYPGHYGTLFSVRNEEVLLVQGSGEEGQHRKGGICTRLWCQEPPCPTSPASLRTALWQNQASLIPALIHGLPRARKGSFGGSRTRAGLLPGTPAKGTHLLCRYPLPSARSGSCTHEAHSTGESEPGALPTTCRGQCLGSFCTCPNSS